MTDRIAAVKTYLLDLQDRICAALEAEDGKARFAED
ncbi:coproporphyrinogen III oxidase, partial [Pseudomonas aeruginosa]|nr:coproporphyrinogen III oxidase [Pseudomonas aeruginosa]